MKGLFRRRRDGGFSCTSPAFKPLTAINSGQSTVKVYESTEFAPIEEGIYGNDSLPDRFPAAQSELGLGVSLVFKSVHFIKVQRLSEQLLLSSQANAFYGFANHLKDMGVKFRNISKQGPLYP
ncbi:hypothetical protein [Pontibacter russatus]|uniref:hypothetical protein n=1 Tax=Pontibacter russatus TaxID=2694929 RepID=UPI0013799F88|nr:hypothetical protein [Pontibacter russatus]